MDDETFTDLLQVLCLIAMIAGYNSARERHYLLRPGVVSAKHSPWVKLLGEGDDGSFLDITGFTKEAFYGLEAAVFPEGQVPSRGRPPMLDNKGRLGLVLLFLGSRMETKFLCLLFGVVPTTANMNINAMLRLVVKKLKRNSAAKVSFPKTQGMRYLSEHFFPLSCHSFLPSPNLYIHHQEKLQEYADMVKQREPDVDNVAIFIDGSALSIQCSEEPDEQMANYNGHTKDTMCNNVLAFAPTGKVVHAAMNYPGSWHDSSVCKVLAALVIQMFGTFCACVDQGFPRSGELAGKFVGPLSKRARAAIPVNERPMRIFLHERYVSLRQASEWGMRALQGTFTRLKSRLTSNKVKRYLIIYSIILLHNFRTEYVGFNQIATVFNAHYQQYINLNGYDRIARYFAF